MPSDNAPLAVPESRISMRDVAAALLAIAVTLVLSAGSLFVERYYATGMDRAIDALSLPDGLHGFANLVLLLVVPNLVVSFCCGFVAFSGVMLLLKPANWQIPAFFAAGLTVIWSLVSLFVFARANHVLLAAQLPGTVLGYMTLGKHRGDDKGWLSIEILMAAAVLVAVLANTLLPRFLYHQYFNPIYGGILKPMEPDPRIPSTFHKVTPVFKSVEEREAERKAQDLEDEAAPPAPRSELTVTVGPDGKKTFAFTPGIIPKRLDR